MADGRRREERIDNVCDTATARDKREEETRVGRAARIRVARGSKRAIRLKAGGRGRVRAVGNRRRA